MSAPGPRSIAPHTTGHHALPGMHIIMATKKPVKAAAKAPAKKAKKK